MSAPEENNDIKLAGTVVKKPRKPRSSSRYITLVQVRSPGYCSVADEMSRKPEDLMYYVQVASGPSEATARKNHKKSGIGGKYKICNVRESGTGTSIRQLQLKTINHLTEKEEPIENNNPRT